MFLRALLSLFMFSFASGDANAISNTSQTFEEFTREVESERAAEELEERKVRQHYLLLRERGGRVVDGGARPLPACTTASAFVQYMTFVLYGKGSAPTSDKCWLLGPGGTFELVESFDASGEFMGKCSPTYDVCRFRKKHLGVLAGSVFYTSIFAFQPLN